MASDARAGILRRPEHLSADTCGPRNLQRGATCFPRNHEGPRHVRTPLPQGCTHLWTTTLRWGSAVHRVVHNGGQATFCTLACTDGTGSSPGTRATRGWGGGCGGKRKTGASTPRAPNGADTHSVYGRSVCAVTPLTLKEGPFAEGPLGVLVLLAGERGVRPVGGGRDEHALVGQKRSALVIGMTAWRTFHTAARQRCSERVRNGLRTPRVTPGPGAPGPCSR